MEFGPMYEGRDARADQTKLEIGWHHATRRGDHQGSNQQSRARETMAQSFPAG